MGQAISVDATLADILGCVLGNSERPVEDLLKGSVQGFAAVRYLGKDDADDHGPLSLFLYDYIPIVNFKDDIKVRPNRFDCSMTVINQLKGLRYDRFYIQLGKELLVVDPGTFHTLLINSPFRIHDDVKTSDYFYL